MSLDHVEVRGADPLAVENAHITSPYIVSQSSAPGLNQPQGNPGWESAAGNGKIFPSAFAKPWLCRADCCYLRVGVRGGKPAHVFGLCNSSPYCAKGDLRSGVPYVLRGGHLWSDFKHSHSVPLSLWLLLVRARHGACGDSFWCLKCFSVCNLVLAHEGKERLKNEENHSRLVSGCFHKERNLHMRLVLVGGVEGKYRTNRPLHPWNSLKSSHHSHAWLWSHIQSRQSHSHLTPSRSCP